MHFRSSHYVAAQWVVSPCGSTTVLGSSQFSLREVGKIVWFPVLPEYTIIVLLTNHFILYCDLVIFYIFQLNLTTNNKQADTNTYVSNAKYDLIDAAAKRSVTFYECCPTEPYIDISYNIQFEKRISNYL